MTNRNIHPSQILDITVLSSVNIMTNHNLVLAKMQRCVQKATKTTHETTKEKLNIESTYDSTTQYLYQQRLTQKIEENRIIIDDNVETAWMKLGTTIIKTAEEALGKQKRVNKKGKTKHRAMVHKRKQDPRKRKKKILSSIPKSNYHL